MALADSDPAPSTGAQRCHDCRRWLRTSVTYWINSVGPLCEVCRDKRDPQPPPEVVVERPSRHNGFRWTWAVCQPNAAWGVIEEGRSTDSAAVRVDALGALNRAMISRGLQPYPAHVLLGS